MDPLSITMMIVVYLKSGLEVINFFMLNSTEYEIYNVHNAKMPTIVGILTFMSMIDMTSESLKGFLFFSILVFMSS